jgi:hypothetical protein
MANDKKFTALELQIEAEQLNKGGVENLELLIQNWKEQAEFTPEELQDEAETLAMILRVASALKAKHPQFDMFIILNAMINALRDALK